MHGRYVAAAGSALHPSPFDSIDSALRLVAALRRAAREQGGPLPSIDVADARLDERRELTELGCKPPRQFSQIPR